MYIYINIINVFSATLGFYRTLRSTWAVCTVILVITLCCHLGINGALGFLPELCDKCSMPYSIRHSHVVVGLLYCLRRSLLGSGNHILWVCPVTTHLFMGLPRYHWLSHIR